MSNHRDLKLNTQIFKGVFLCSLFHSLFEVENGGRHGSAVGRQDITASQTGLVLGELLIGKAN